MRGFILVFISDAFAGRAGDVISSPGTSSRDQQVSEKSRKARHELIKLIFIGAGLRMLSSKIQVLPLYYKILFLPPKDKYAEHRTTLTVGWQTDPKFSKPLMQLQHDVVLLVFFDFLEYVSWQVLSSEKKKNKDAAIIKEMFTKEYQLHQMTA